MLISLNWLNDYVKIPSKYSPEQLGDMLTLHTAEVEEVVAQGKSLDNMVVGEVLELKKHPDADKLKIAMVNVGKKDPVQVVCGGNNLDVGQKIAFAPPGAWVRWHGEGDLVQLAEVKIRGVESFGMICAGEEIGLPPAPPEGITVLDTDAKAGTPLAKALGMDDIVLEIDNKSLTHRPDLWGHYGIAREVAALTGSKLAPISPKKPTEGSEKLSIEVKDKELCPRYLGVKISGIKVEKSPEWLRKKLEAAGHVTYNNIVDITNFISSELGQPMHAFDVRYIEGGINVRKAKNGEVMTTLDGTKHKLTEKNLVIADHTKAVALAGVMGGQDSEIQDDTTEIIFEAANFDAVSVRKTSASLGLRTEAVQRFEKSLDPALAELGMLRAIELLLEICPTAKLSSKIIDINHSKPKTLVIKTTAEKVSSKIGTKISEANIKKILTSLEFKVKKSGDFLEVEVPSFRATRDIETEDDIIEEVVRIFGYNNIPTKLPSLPTKLPVENRERFLKHKARDIISLGMSFTEVSNYSFYSEEDISKAMLDEKDHLKLHNFLSQDQTHMRTSLLPNMLKSLHEALKHQCCPKIYEIGRTYLEKGDYMPLEEKHILALRDSFAKAKGAAETFLTKFGTYEPKIVEPRAAAAYTHPSKCADILVKGQKVGSIYEIHPQVLKNYGIKKEFAAFEINFTKLVELGLQDHKYSPIPRFPSVQFDVSVVFPEKVTAERAQKAIKQANKDLIQEIELFDIYRGEGLKDNEKALAYHIELRADNRTLTDEEMAETQKAVFKKLEGLGGKIRGK